MSGKSEKKKDKKSFTYHVSELEHKKIRALVLSYQKEIDDSGIPGKVSISSIIIGYINSDFKNRGLSESDLTSEELSCRGFGNKLQKRFLRS